MPRRLQLEGDSLPQLKARILAEYGPAAQITDAELVTEGGVWGFFARRHFKVTVLVPDSASPGAHASNAVQALSTRPDLGDLSTLSARIERAGIAGRPGPEGRAGLAALLDDADHAEARMAGTGDSHVSTGSDAFSRLMNDLTSHTHLNDVAVEATAQRPADATVPQGADAHQARTASPAAHAPRVTDDTGPGIAAARFAARAMLGTSPVTSGSRAKSPGAAAAPAVLTEPGDLVLVVGLGDEAHATARAMATSVGSSWVTAGRSPGPTDSGASATGARPGLSPSVMRASVLGQMGDAVHDRRSALGARARGVQTGHSVFVAVGLDAAGRDLPELATVMTAVSADQVWLSVDAGRKAEDTAAWVRQVTAIVAVDAVAATGRERTATPSTVDDLGLPLVWLDDAGNWPSA